MRRKTSVQVVLVLVIVIGVLARFPQRFEAAGDRHSIGIIQYVEHQALDASREGFLAALAANGYLDGESIDVDYQNAQGDASNLSTISDRFVGRKVDLVLAIATPAAQSIASKTTEIPILGTAITDYVVARLVDSVEHPGGNISGTTDMNPVKEQIDLIVTLVPDVQTVGLLYTSSEDNSTLQARLAKEAILALGLDYVEVTISSSSEVQQATQSIVRRVDAIYIPTDNIFASAMPIVYGVVSQSKTPVIVGETGMARAGGVATLGINYYDLGYQTGEMAVQVLEGESPANMPIEGAKGFDYAVNGEMAKEIGLEIPAHLLDYVMDTN